MLVPALLLVCWRRLALAFVLLIAAAGSAQAAGVHLQWHANTESDLAGYVVLYGTSSGLYTQSLEIGPATPEADVSGLTAGTTYYFAVRAFNGSGLQSGLSNEIAIALPSVLGPAPTISTLSPVSGTVAGGTSVTISGTNFASGLTVKFGSTTATVTSVSASTIVAVTPARTAGVVSVTVTNPDAQAVTKSNAYTYLGNPTITSFTPTSGVTGGGALVTISGTNFTTGAIVRFGPTLAPVMSVSATSIVVQTPSMSAGAVPVSVTLVSGQSATANTSFTYLADAPVISAVGPVSGSTAGGTIVTITGSHFLPGTTVLLATVPATVSSVTATAITVVTPAHAAGQVGVTVANPGGGLFTKPNAFTYIAFPPVVASVAPDDGPVAGGNTVVVHGQHFDLTSVVSFGGIAATVTAATATTLTVTVPARTAGTVTLTVRNADGQFGSAAGAYTYDAFSPSLTALSPTRGPIEGGTSVTLSGANFTSGVTVTFAGVPATVVSATPTHIVVSTPAGSAGAAAVSVRNTDGLAATLGQAFVYDAPEEPAQTFVRYFAEGVQGSFFRTRFALANPHLEPVHVEATFTDVFGRESTMSLDVAPGGRATVDHTSMPTLASEAFATKFESAVEIGIDRTVVWNNGEPYGAHSETGIEAPRTVWYFAEGATHSGFDLFYLLQNPSNQAAEVLVRYMLGTGQVLEKVHFVPARARTNIWVNLDDPVLAAAEVSAQLISLNNVPIVAERSMYQNVNGQLFTAGHNSGGIAEPSTRWFLAEGATGEYFDTFILIANPNPTAARLFVTYMLPEGAPVELTYTVGANSRFTIWVDHEHPRLANTDLSVVVASTNGVPVIVERTMWWPGTPGGGWTEAHNSAGATTTSPRWVMADGVSSAAQGATTYALVANTGATPTLVRFTLLTPAGRGRAVETSIAPNSRFSIDVAQTFPEALNSTFGLLIESTDDAPLVVERASYWNAGGIPWAAGTNSLASPLRTRPAGVPDTH